MITLYHGSNVRIKDIDLSRCNPYKDFGQAFYLTSDKIRARDVALARVDIFGGEPVVNEYHFDESLLEDGTFSYKSFDSYTEDGQISFTSIEMTVFAVISSSRCTSEHRDAGPRFSPSLPARPAISSRHGMPERVGHDETAAAEDKGLWGA